MRALPFLGALLLATPAVAADGPAANLQPASAAAILAAGTACVGTTVDPAGQPGRLAGWQSATPAERSKMKVDGDVVMRDNVMLIYRTGVDGGCVVMARPDAAFDRTAFYADLGKALGVTIVTDGKEPVTKLPNGELLVAQDMAEGDVKLVTLVVGNPNGKYAKGKDK